MSIRTQSRRFNRIRLETFIQKAFLTNRIVWLTVDVFLLGCIVLNLLTLHVVVWLHPSQGVRLSLQRRHDCAPAAKRFYDKQEIRRKTRLHSLNHLLQQLDCMLPFCPWQQGKEECHQRGSPHWDCIPHQLYSNNRQVAGQFGVFYATVPKTITRVVGIFQTRAAIWSGVLPA